MTDQFALAILILIVRPKKLKINLLYIIIIIIPLYINSDGGGKFLLGFWDVEVAGAMSHTEMELLNNNHAKEVATWSSWTS